MSIFDGRERAFESKFTHNLEDRFKIKALTVFILAEWAAKKLKFSEAELDEYQTKLLASNIKDFTACIEHIYQMLIDKNAKVTKIEFLHEVESAIDKAHKEFSKPRTR